ncbi:biotin transporter BioY [Picosynechococcus sp. PCC 11901]|uniref:biotin transporter BioY n=1 Tax=unclassified Picosynechococcus TaxID=3079910 RepID=UPI0004AA85F1|nr:biotin biosynthesis protein BioY [Picosynechococcus sp. PCC 7117]QCS48952.1 biotin transporter BioY [Picosynechococcus sp. PCC 11901]
MKAKALPRSLSPKQTATTGPNWFNQLLWALIGVSLTIGGTFIEAHRLNLPWDWSTAGLQTQSLGIYCQVAAVLLTGCLGGKNAGIIAQIAYILIGLFWLPVFSQGGKLGYLTEPTFGYILGFIPAAGICGWLAFRYVLSLEALALSAFCGLIALHSCGILYLVGLTLLEKLQATELSLLQAIALYSVTPFPSQLMLVCGVAVLAYGVRRILFY